MRVSTLRISDTQTLHHELPSKIRRTEDPPPHLHTSPGPATFNPAALQFFLELVDSFGDASTAFSLDALRFNTLRMLMRISIKLSGVF